MYIIWQFIASYNTDNAAKVSWEAYISGPLQDYSDVFM
jgi:hypothetical protein